MLKIILFINYFTFRQQTRVRQMASFTIDPHFDPNPTRSSLRSLEADLEDDTGQKMNIVMAPSNQNVAVTPNVPTGFGTFQSPTSVGVDINQPAPSVTPQMPVGIRPTVVPQVVPPVARPITGGTMSSSQPPNITQSTLINPANTPSVPIVQTGLVQRRRSQWESIQKKHFQGTSKQPVSQAQGASTTSLSKQIPKKASTSSVEGSAKKASPSAIKKKLPAKTESASSLDTKSEKSGSSSSLNKKSQKSGSTSSLSSKSSKTKTASKDSAKDLSKTPSSSSVDKDSDKSGSKTDVHPKSRSASADKVDAGSKGSTSSIDKKKSGSAKKVNWMDRRQVSER